MLVVSAVKVALVFVGFVASSSAQDSATSLRGTEEPGNLIVNPTEAVDAGPVAASVCKKCVYKGCFPDGKMPIPGGCATQWKCPADWLRCYAFQCKYCKRKGCYDYDTTSAASVPANCAKWGCANIKAKCSSGSCNKCRRANCFNPKGNEKRCNSMACVASSCIKNPCENSDNPDCLKGLCTRCERMKCKERITKNCEKRGCYLGLCANLSSVSTTKTPPIKPPTREEPCVKCRKCQAGEDEDCDGIDCDDCTKSVDCSTCQKCRTISTGVDKYCDSVMEECGKKCTLPPVKVDCDTCKKCRTVATGIDQYCDTVMEECDKKCPVRPVEVDCGKCQKCRASIMSSTGVVDDDCDMDMCDIKCPVRPIERTCHTCHRCWATKDYEMCMKLDCEECTPPKDHCESDTCQKCLDTDMGDELCKKMLCHKCNRPDDRCDKCGQCIKEVEGEENGWEKCQDPCPGCKEFACPSCKMCWNMFGRDSKECEKVCNDCPELVKHRCDECNKCRNSPTDEDCDDVCPGYCPPPKVGPHDIVERCFGCKQCLRKGNAEDCHDVCLEECISPPHLNACAKCEECVDSHPLDGKGIEICKNYCPRECFAKVYPPVLEYRCMACDKCMAFEGTNEKDCQAVCQDDCLKREPDGCAECRMCMLREDGVERNVCQAEHCHQDCLTHIAKDCRKCHKCHTGHMEDSDCEDLDCSGCAFTVTQPANNLCQDCHKCMQSGDHDRCNKMGCDRIRCPELGVNGP